MADADDIADAIVEAAQGPSSASNDQGSVTQHNLKDLIEAQKFAASHGVRTDPFSAVRRRKIVPGGGG